METMLEKDEKLGGKTHKKFLHKLNKQQTERWRHAANVREFFFTEIQFWSKVLMETVWKKFADFEAKKHTNASISWINSKQNDGTTYKM